MDRNMKKGTAVAVMLLMVLSAMMVFTGCSGGDEEKPVMAEKTMENKYGETFSCHETRPAAEGSYFAWLRPASNQDIVVKAVISEDGISSDDNYVAKIICHEISEKANEILKNHPGELFIYTGNIMDIVSETDTNITPGEYLEKHPGDRFDIAVFVERDGLDSAELYRELVKVRQEIGVKEGSITAYAVENENLKDIESEFEAHDEFGTPRLETLLEKSGYCLIPLSPTESIPTESEFMVEMTKGSTQLYAKGESLGEK